MHGIANINSTPGIIQVNSSGCSNAAIIKLKLKTLRISRF